MNFISCTKWIKRGVAKSTPDKVKLTQCELEKLVKSARKKIKKELDENQMDEDEPSASTSEGNNSNQQESLSMRFGLDNLITFENDKHEIDDSDDSDQDDINILPTDNLIVVGHVEEDASTLEVYVYNEEDLYVHHDIMLESIPLCLEWLDHDPADSNPGNLLAVGTMSPVINVWDLDIINCLEPAYVLGKYSVKKKHNKSHGHKDAVLALAWNAHYKHILASGSVDETVLLWDLDVGTASTTFAEFTDKVQSVKWQPNDYHLLLAGSADTSAQLFDCRMTETKNKFVVGEAIEIVAWSPWDSNKFYLGSCEGNLFHYDLRHSNEAIWTEKAHEGEISGLELDVKCPNLLFTSSADEYIKIWDVENDRPRLLKSEKLSLKEIQSLDLNPDCPYIACVGGTKKESNFRVINFKKMLSSLGPSDPTEATVDTTAEDFDDFQSSSLTLNNNNSNSSSIKNKKLKSKKKFGHKFRQ